MGVFGIGVFCVGVPDLDVPVILETPDDSEPVSLGGMSISESSSSADVSSLRVSKEEPRTFPTKQQRVFISSITASVRISWGTRVERFAAGALMAALSDAGGGR